LQRYRKRFFWIPKFFDDFGVNVEMLCCLLEALARLSEQTCHILVPPLLVCFVKIFGSWLRARMVLNRPNIVDFLFRVSLLELQ
jgi:hypothetical protein